MRVRIVEGPGRDNGQGARVDSLFRNLVKPSEMPKPLALTGITAHTHKHFTSSDKTQKKKKNGECVKFLEIKFEKSV